MFYKHIFQFGINKTRGCFEVVCLLHVSDVCEHILFCTDIIGDCFVAV